MKIKNIEREIKKYNQTEKTARLFFDPPSKRIECRIYEHPTLGRFDYHKPEEILIISKEDNNEPELTIEALKELIRVSLEEFEEGYN